MDERVPACPVAALPARMVVGEVEDLPERIVQARKPEWRSLVLDLGAVEVLGSLGVRALLRLERWCRANRLWFELRNPSIEALRVCRLAGLGALLEAADRTTGGPVELCMPADRDMVVPQLDEIERAMTDLGLPQPAALRARLVLEELLLNSVTHGKPPSDRIDVRISMHGPMSRVQVGDDAGAFDPFTAALEAHPEDLAQRRIGGLGLPLVRKSCDWARYRRVDGRNLVEVGFLPDLA